MQPSTVKRGRYSVDSRADEASEDEEVEYSENDTPGEDEDAEDEGDEDDDQPTPPHPHFNAALRRSRRKSVSFAVCKVDKETMQFDIQHKSVLLGNMSQHVSSATGSLALAGRKMGAPASPLLTEVTKKWREAKNKLVLKEKVDFPDEIFAKKRQELMDQAKQKATIAPKETSGVHSTSVNSRTIPTTPTPTSTDVAIALEAVEAAGSSAEAAAAFVTKDIDETAI